MSLFPLFSFQRMKNDISIKNGILGQEENRDKRPARGSGAYRRSGFKFSDKRSHRQ